VNRSLTLSILMMIILVLGACNGPPQATPTSVSPPSASTSDLCRADPGNPSPSVKIKASGDEPENTINIEAQGQIIAFTAVVDSENVDYKWTRVGSGSLVNDTGRVVQYQMPPPVSKQEQITITVTVTNKKTRCSATADITVQLLPAATSTQTASPTSQVTSTNTPTSSPTSTSASSPTGTSTSQITPTNTPASSPPGTSASTCTPTPRAGPAPLGFADDLDDDSTDWDIYIDPQTHAATAQWEINNVSTAGRTGNALRVAIAGGQPYTNIHAFSTLYDVPAQATAFRLELCWRFSQTTFNNQGGRSRVQAVELTTSKWQAGRRYQWALQWMNVPATRGGRAPIWALWDGIAWVDTGVGQQLVPEQWHHFILQGDITADGQIRYVSFTSDGVPTSLGQEFAPTQGDNNGDRITVAFQLDGNAREDRYECLFDNVRLEWFATTPW